MITLSTDEGNPTYLHVATNKLAIAWMRGSTGCSRGAEWADGDSRYFYWNQPAPPCWYTLRVV